MNDRAQAWVNLIGQDYAQLVGGLPDLTIQCISPDSYTVVDRARSVQFSFTFPGEPNSAAGRLQAQSVARALNERALFRK